MAVHGLFDKSKGQSIDPETVIKYLVENREALESLTCKEVLNDETLPQLSRFLQAEHHRLLHLERLCLPGNGFTFSASSAIADIINSVQSLKELDLSGNYLAFKGFSNICQCSSLASPNICGLRKLDISDNHLDSKAGAAIASIIQHNHSLRSLNISKNNLRRKFKSIAEALCQNSTLFSLDVSHNGIGDQGIIALAPVLDADRSVSVSRLRELTLQYNKIGSTGANVLAGVLLGNVLQEGVVAEGRPNTTLRRLDLSYNNITADGAHSMGILLKFSYTLEELLLARNDIRDEGVSYLVAGLQSSIEYSGSALRLLNLDWNSILCPGAGLLADLLWSNGTLVELSLESNGIADEGAIALARSLQAAASLRILNLCGNQIRRQGAEFLSQALIQPDCHQITVEWMENNAMTRAGEADMEAVPRFRANYRNWLKLIFGRIDSGKSTVVLDLSERQIGDAEVSELAKHLRMRLGLDFRPDDDDDARPLKCELLFLREELVTKRSIRSLAEVMKSPRFRLRKLYLAGIALGNSGAKLIARVIARNHEVMQSVSLSSCLISDDGALEIAHSLCDNGSLRHLDLSGNKIRDRGARALLRSVLAPAHPSLLTLALSRNVIGDTALDDLPSIEKLEGLYLENNHITDRGALDIAKACLKCGSLIWLGISGNEVTSKGEATLSLFLPPLYQMC